MSALTSPSSTIRALHRFVPAIQALRGYTPAAARADVLAGLSVAAVAVPQAIAYAMIAGLPGEYGLYAAIVMTAIGALLDSSRQLINGPTNAISIALLSAVGAIESQDARIQAAILMTFMIGAIQLGISFLRLGDLTRYISHSVIVGFTAGASVLLVLDQLKNLLGLPAQGSAHDHFLHRFFLTMSDVGRLHGPTAAVGVGSIALVLALRWLKRRLKAPLFPEFLAVVVAMAALTSILGLDQHGVRVVGDIPARLPSFRLPELDAAQMRELANAAFALALLGLLEAVSMAKAIAAVTGQRLDLNQQCLSEGFANFGGSFFQCMPGSGSLTRSAINQQAGAQTQWSGVVSAGAVALVMVVFAPYAHFIPRAALAGLLMLTAARMVNLRELRYHMRVSHFDKAIVVVTAVSAIAVSIEFCVLVGVFMSFLLAVPRTGNMLLTEFVVAPEGGVHERLPQDDVCGRILIFGIEGEMYFGSAASLEQHLDDIEARIQPETKVLVLRMKRARNPDAVGLAILERSLDRIRARGVHVLMCGVRQVFFESMERCGLADKVDRRNVFLEQPVRATSTLLAIRHAYDLVTEPCVTCPRRDAAVRERQLYYVP
jgi:SulP family sulfate permease